MGGAGIESRGGEKFHRSCHLPLVVIKKAAEDGLFDNGTSCN